MYGVLHEAFPVDEAQCLGDIKEIEQHVTQSIHDFELKTFEGMRQGLDEAGSAFKLIPTALSECKSIQKDLTELAKKAVVFTHPLTLIYTVGKSLILNGSDILTKIEAAITAYHKADYYEFGS